MTKQNRFYWRINTHNTKCLYMCESVKLKPLTEHIKTRCVCVCVWVPVSEQEMNIICPRCHIRNTRCSLSKLDVSVGFYFLSFLFAFTWAHLEKLNIHIFSFNHTFFSGASACSCSNIPVLSWHLNVKIPFVFFPS